MEITNETTTLQIAELVGPPEADEWDGHRVMGMLSREYTTDTSDIAKSKWLEMIWECKRIRERENFLLREMKRDTDYWNNRDRKKGLV